MQRNSELTDTPLRQTCGYRVAAAGLRRNDVRTDPLRLQGGGGSFELVQLLQARGSLHVFTSHQCMGRWCD